MLRLFMLAWIRFNSYQILLKMKPFSKKAMCADCTLKHIFKKAKCVIKYFLIITVQKYQMLKIKPRPRESRHKPLQKNGVYGTEQ